MRSRIQAQVFLGLFLIVFGLFAAQIKKKPSTIEAKPNPLFIEPTPEPISQTRIQVLYDQVAIEKIFSNQISGVKLLPARASVKNDFKIIFEGDEVYSDHAISVHSSWETTLDFIAELIKKNPGLHVDIAGFADLENPKENKPSDFPTALASSFARAEWVAHHFERKHGIIVAKSMVLMGMGAVPQGKKLVLRFYYGT